MDDLEPEDVVDLEDQRCHNEFASWTFKKQFPYFYRVIETREEVRDWKRKRFLH